MLTKVIMMMVTKVEAFSGSSWVNKGCAQWPWWNDCEQIWLNLSLSLHSSFSLTLFEWYVCDICVISVWYLWTLLGFVAMQTINWRWPEFRRLFSSIHTNLCSVVCPNWCSTTTVLNWTELNFWTLLCSKSLFPSLHTTFVQQQLWSPATGLECNKRFQKYSRIFTNIWIFWKHI